MSISHIRPKAIRPMEPGRSEPKAAKRPAQRDHFSLDGSSNFTEMVASVRDLPPPAPKSEAELEAIRAQIEAGEFQVDPNGIAETLYHEFSLRGPLPNATE